MSTKNSENSPVRVVSLVLSPIPVLLPSCLENLAANKGQMENHGWTAKHVNLTQILRAGLISAIHQSSDISLTPEVQMYIEGRRLSGTHLFDFALLRRAKLPSSS